MAKTKTVDTFQDFEHKISARLDEMKQKRYTIKHTEKKIEDCRKEIQELEAKVGVYLQQLRKQEEDFTGFVQKIELSKLK